MNKYVCSVVLCLVFLPGCSKERVSVSRPLLGTIVNMTLYCDREDAPGAAGAAFDEISRIEGAMSPYINESDISRINAGAGRFVTVSEENSELIQQALAISKETGGAFDISFASIARLWNYKNKQFTLPDPGLVNRLKKYVNYKNVTVRGNRVRLKYPQMKIGLGGIAKGYAIGRAVTRLKEQGVTAGIVEAGGDLQVFGSKGWFTSWRTGVMHPRKKSIIMIVDLEDGDSIATSGDYERVVMYKGKRYHHIIDPRSGYPADTFASVSVITKDPVLSDAYATSLFVMGLEKAKVFLAGHSEVAAVFIDMDMKVHTSQALRDRIESVERINIEWF